VEHLIAWHYGWTVRDIDRLPWIEVFDHIRAIFIARSNDLRWDTATSSYSQMERKGRSSVDDAIKELSTSGEDLHPDNKSGSSTKHAAYDSMPDEARLLSIGSCLANEGLDFLDRRPHHRAWLEDKGISPDECRLRYTQWRAEKDADKERRAAGGDPVGGDD